jgi:hypothetical protein
MLEILSAISTFPTGKRIGWTTGSQHGSTEGNIPTYDHVLQEECVFDGSSCSIGHVFFLLPPHFRFFGVDDLLTTHRPDIGILGHPTVWIIGRCIGFPWHVLT